MFYGGISKKDKKNRNEFFDEDIIIKNQQSPTPKSKIAYSSNGANQNMHYSNINEGFYQNTPLINSPDYTNKKNVLHNNLSDNLLSENINEYNIYIDSNDRNKTNYYSPFEFKVNFGINGDTPKIDQEFNNVKFINLNYLILPPTNVIFAQTTSDFTTGGRGILNSYLISDASNSPPSITLGAGITWPITINSFTKNRYIILKIKELDNCKIKSTSCYSSTGIDKNSFVLFYDDDVKDDSGNIIATIWKPKFGGGSRVFLSSELKSIKSFTITLYDQYGNQIVPVDNTIPSVDNSHNVVNEAPNNGLGIVIPQLLPSVVYDISENKITSTNSLVFVNNLEDGNYYNNLTYDKFGNITDVDGQLSIFAYSYYTIKVPPFPTDFTGYTQDQINSFVQTYNKTNPNLKSLGSQFELNYNMQLSFTFGVVECELNTSTKYYR